MEEKIETTGEATLRHDAGHFVAYWRMGVPVTMVKGHYAIASHRPDCFCDVIAHLAGYAAEGKEFFTSRDPDAQIIEAAEWLGRAIETGEGGAPFPGEKFCTGDPSRLGAWGLYSFLPGNTDLQNVLYASGFGRCTQRKAKQRIKAWNSALNQFPKLLVYGLKDAEKLIRDNEAKVNEVADLLGQNNGGLDAAACKAVLAKWGEPEGCYWQGDLYIIFAVI